MADSGSATRVFFFFQYSAIPRYFPLLSLFLLFVFHTAAATASSSARSTQCPNEPAGRLQEAESQVCPVPGRIGIVNASHDNDMSWTFLPKCLDNTSKTDNTSSSLHCLFTSPEFRNGHGISLVTTTTSASHLIGLDAFVDKPMLHVARQGASLEPAYEVLPVEGKGQGVVARRRIRRGEIIMVDVPAVLIAVSFLAETKPHHRRRLLKQALNQLPEETRSRSYGLGRSSSKYEVDAIMGPNSNTVVVADDQVHVGLFTEVAVRCK